MPDPNTNPACWHSGCLLEDVEAERDHYKAALERVVFVHADAPEVSAWDLADIAGEALDVNPLNQEDQ